MVNTYIVAELRYHLRYILGNYIIVRFFEFIKYFYFTKWFSKNTVHVQISIQWIVRSSWFDVIIIIMNIATEQMIALRDTCIQEDELGASLVTTIDSLIIVFNSVCVYTVTIDINDACIWQKFEKQAKLGINTIQDMIAKRANAPIRSMSSIVFVSMRWM